MKKETEKFRKMLFKANEKIEEMMSELEFFQDEQKFLEHLLSAHFLDLSTEKYYEPTKKLIGKLKEVEKMSQEMDKQLHLHNNRLAVLLEKLDVSKRKSFKKEHKKILEDFYNYSVRLKYVKKKIFSMIKNIMKNQKHKFLIAEQ